jgi:hypothetical protein
VPPAAGLLAVLLPKPMPSTRRFSYCVGTKPYSSAPSILRWLIAGSRATSTRNGVVSAPGLKKRLIPPTSMVKATGGSGLWVIGVKTSISIRLMAVRKVGTVSNGMPFTTGDLYRMWTGSWLSMVM